MTRQLSETPVPQREPAKSFRYTLQAFSAAQKPAAPGAPAYSVLVNRKLGRFLAAAAYRAGMSANAITGLSALLTFTGIILLAAVEPTVLLGITVWILLALGYALDSADGQVARMRGGGSPAGEWLDHVIDCAKISTVHLAVLITAYRHFDLPHGWLLVPIGYCIVAAVSFFTMILNDQLKAVHVLKTGAVFHRSNRSAGRSFLLLPTDYGLFCMAFILLGSPPVFFSIYSLLFAANSLHLVLAAHKWFRDLARLGKTEVRS